MPKMQTVKGVLRTFWWMTKEDWQQLDHKLYRVAAGLTMFAAVALFWLYFLRNVLPF